MKRVDQLLSALGYGSRKEAGQWCRAGRVTVNGKVQRDAGERVEPAEVALDGVPLEFPNGMLVMINKPVGVVCTHDSREGHRIYDLMPPRWQQRDPKVTTVGRLDKDTSGLLLVTDDGALVQRLTSPKHHVQKTYEVTVDAPIPTELVKKFTAGIELREGPAIEKTLPSTLVLTGERSASVTIQEGRYHQVRRMFAACGLEVATLHRTQFGEYTLGSLATGAWLDLKA